MARSLITPPGRGLCPFYKRREPRRRLRIGDKTTSAARRRRIASPDSRTPARAASLNVHIRSHPMHASRSTVRLSCCLLAYALIASLLAPTSWPSVASSTASRAAVISRSDAPRRAGELLVRFGGGLTERGKDDI